MVMVHSTVIVRKCGCAWQSKVCARVCLFSEL